MQQEMNKGIFALTVAAQILGVPAEYGQLKFTSPSGNNELGILRAAKDLGLKSKIVETKKPMFSLPCKLLLKIFAII
jgi:hypothetical protein